MEARRWKLLHYSAQNVIKENQPSPYKDRFRSSKDKQNLSKDKVVNRDRSNKLLHYVNSYLEGKSSKSKDKVIKNQNYILALKENTTRQSIASQYFQVYTTGGTSDDPLLSQNSLTPTHPQVNASSERRPKCKTQFSVATTQRENISNATPQIILQKQNSQKVSSKNTQRGTKKSKAIKLHYLNN